MLNFVIWRPFFFKILSKFVHIVHTNFHAKSGVCSSKNERVMALGMKEDGHFAEVEVGKEEELIIFKGLYSPNFRVRSSKVWTIDI